MSKSKNTATYEKIGERIRAMRERRKMTQTELAGDDITRNMLSRIENGAALPSLPSLCAIADRLEIPVGVLFGDAKEYEVYRESISIHSLIDRGEIENAIAAYSCSESTDFPENLKKRVAAAAVDYAYCSYSRGKISEALSLIEFAA